MRDKMDLIREEKMIFEGMFPDYMDSTNFSRLKSPNGTKVIPGFPPFVQTMPKSQIQNYPSPFSKMAKELNFGA
jgi:hypothetical protein